MALSVGEPLKNSEIWDERESEALNPMTRRITPITRSARLMGLFMRR
jgi:hypothetical protein